MSWELRTADCAACVPLLPLLSAPLLALVTPAVAALYPTGPLGMAYTGALGLMFLTGVVMLLASPVLWLTGVLPGGRTLLCLGLAGADVVVAAALFLWAFIESVKTRGLMF